MTDYFGNNKLAYNGSVYDPSKLNQTFMNAPQAGGYGSQIAADAAGKSFGGGDLFGALDSTSVGPNGQAITNQGWGGLALGLGGLASNWIMGNKQMDFGREQLDFSKEQFQKNYAAQMDAYRRAANKNTGMLSYANDRRDGTTDRGLSETLSAYNDGGRMIDTVGNTVADPTYGAVEASAFADPALTSAGQSALLNESLYSSTVPSRDTARKDSTRDSNTEQQADEQDAVKKIL